MMTREEAIAEKLEQMSPDQLYRFLRKLCNAYLRPVSRARPKGTLSAAEPPRAQVEKVWRGEWLHDPETGYEYCDKCAHTISLDDYLNKKPPLFCEMCGDAKTDEAVQMVLKRWEELYEIPPTT